MSTIPGDNSPLAAELVHGLIQHFHTKCKRLDADPFVMTMNQAVERRVRLKFERREAVALCAEFGKELGFQVFISSGRLLDEKLKER